MYISAPTDILYNGKYFAVAVCTCFGQILRKRSDAPMLNGITYYQIRVVACSGTIQYRNVMYMYMYHASGAHTTNIWHW